MNNIVKALKRLLEEKKNLGPQMPKQLFKKIYLTEYICKYICKIHTFFKKKICKNLVQMGVT